MQFLKLVITLGFAVLANAYALANQTQSTPPPMVAEPGRRRGIPYNDPGFIKYFHVPGAQLGWSYNWNAQTTDYGWDSLEYVPMLWSSTPDLTATWWACYQECRKCTAGQRYTPPELQRA